jgi:hypothetical protein
MFAIGHQRHLRIAESVEYLSYPIEREVGLDRCEGHAGASGSLQSHHRGRSSIHDDGQPSGPADDPANQLLVLHQFEKPVGDRRRPMLELTKGD